MQVKVVDTAGNTHELNELEAKKAVTTGAYTYADPEKKKQTQMGVNVLGAYNHGMSTGKVQVRDKASGKVYELTLINAREAIESGYYDWVQGDYNKPKIKSVNFTSSKQKPAPINPPEPEKEVSNDEIAEAVDYELAGPQADEVPVVEQEKEEQQAPRRKR